MTDPMTADMPDTMVKYWSVHSSKNNQPMYRGVAPSESEARKLLEEIRSDDGNSEDEYWTIQMTAGELELFQAMGEVPADA